MYPPTCMGAEAPKPPLRAPAAGLSAAPHRGWGGASAALTELRDKTAGTVRITAGEHAA